MKEKEDCFLKVKKDYIKFLKKEKIFGQTIGPFILTSLKLIHVSFYKHETYQHGFPMICKS